MEWGASGRWPPDDRGRRRVIVTFPWIVGHGPDLAAERPFPGGLIRGGGPLVAAITQYPLWEAP
jgi:hypothetical protein